VGCPGYQKEILAKGNCHPAQVAFVLATFVASAPAAAQSWEQYSYPDYAFSVAFPANPQVENTTYEVAVGRSVPARVYSLSQSNVIFKVTLAELEGTNVDESAIVDHAIKTLTQGATRGRTGANSPGLLGKDGCSAQVSGTTAVPQLADDFLHRRSRRSRATAH
jgi:hypothetical protein